MEHWLNLCFLQNQISPFQRDDIRSKYPSSLRTQISLAGSEFKYVISKGTMPRQQSALVSIWKKEVALLPDEQCFVERIQMPPLLCLIPQDVLETHIFGIVDIRDLFKCVYVFYLTFFLHNTVFVSVWGALANLPFCVVLIGTL